MTTSATLTPANKPDLRTANRRLGVKLFMLAIGMIGFSAFLWYTGGLLCDWGGIGFNPGGGPQDGPPASEIRMGVEVPAAVAPVEQMPEENH